jgi:hypothetical protein
MLISRTVSRSSSEVERAALVVKSTMKEKITAALD